MHNDEATGMAVYDYPFLRMSDLEGQLRTIHVNSRGVSERQVEIS